MMVEVTRNRVSPTQICENPQHEPGQTFLFYQHKRGYTKLITSHEAQRALRMVIDYMKLNEQDPEVFIFLGQMQERLEQSERDSQQERDYEDICRQTGLH